MTADGISRTQAKKQRKALEAIGKQLIALPAGDVRAAPLPERLRDAVLEGQRMKRSALRRHLLHVGRLLSELGEDAEPIIDFVARGRQRDRDEAESFHALEAWRERLLEEGDAALDELVGQHPQADRRHLRRLVRAAIEERKRERPPVASRRLFRDLRELLGSD